MKPPKIKTIIPTSRDYFAAFLPDKENDIQRRVERIVCWSLIERLNPDDADEVVGQFVEGDVITEVTNVDHEEGFGPFLGYFDSEEAAAHALITKEATDEESENGEDEDDDEEGDDEEGEGEEEDDDLDEDEDEDEDDEDWDDESDESDDDSDDESDEDE